MFEPTLPPWRTIQASVGGPPLMDSVAVMLNLIFSFIWAFCCFFELMPSATPVTVGIAETMSSPKTMVSFAPLFFVVVLLAFVDVVTVLVLISSRVSVLISSCRLVESGAA